MRLAARRTKHNYGRRLPWRRVTVNITPKSSLPVATIGVDELSIIVRQSRSVVLRTMRLNPERLPHPARRVGRNYIWLPDEVESWLRAGSQAAHQPSIAAPAPGQKRGRGRPRKELSRGGEK